MKSQSQNLQKHLNGDYSNQEAILNASVSCAITDGSDRICYKKRREELNRRVKSIIEQKKQASYARN